MSRLQSSSRENGYLLSVRAKAEPPEVQAWAFLITADFEPLREMGNALARLAGRAKEVAESHNCDLEEKSVGRLDDEYPPDSPARPRGRMADLRDYTYPDGSANAERLGCHLELMLQGKQVRECLPVTGAVARAGESLLGREQARQELLQAIAQGPVMLLGPRRSGRTSLLYWLVDEPPENWATLYTDLEQTSDPTSFAIEVYALMLRHPALARISASYRPFGPEFARLPDHPTGERAWRSALYDKIGQNWADFIRKTMVSVGQAPAPLLLLDEFGDFLTSLEETDDFQPFVGFVREFLASPGPYRVLVTGSRGLEYLIERLHVSAALERFTRFPLPSFGEPSARRLFEERLRCRQVRPTKAVIDKAIALVGSQVPFHLQMLADAVLSNMPAGDLSDPALVEKAYHEVLLGYPGQAYFDELERRLKSYDMFHRRRAGQQMLRLVAERGQVEEAEMEYKLKQTGRTKQDLAELLALLEEYFFLEKAGTCWRFRIPLLRDYVLRHYPPARF